MKSISNWCTAHSNSESVGSILLLYSATPFNAYIVSYVDVRGDSAVQVQLNQTQC